MACEQVRVLALDTEQVLNKKGMERIITPETQKCKQKLGFFTRWLRFHPYVWDEALNAPLVARRLSFWRWHLMSGIVFYVLILVRTVQVTIVRPGSTFEQMFALFMASWFSVFMVTQMHAASNRDRTVCWIQGFFLLMKKCEGNILWSIEVFERYIVTERNIVPLRIVSARMFRKVLEIR